MILLAVLALVSSLEDGIANMQIGNTQEAAKHFEETLSNDRINEMGKAIAYWNLYQIYFKDPQTRDKSGNYLLGFIVYAEDIIEISSKDTNGYWINFVESNNLRVQLDVAKEQLDIMWKKRNNGQVLQ